MKFQNDFYEILNRADFLKNGEVNKSRIERASVSDIIDLAGTITEVTSLPEIKRNNSTFVFSASNSLSGNTFPCGSIECRINRAFELAQFAALYSDQIYIRNFFSRYLYHDPADIDTLRYFLYGDLRVLALIEPLVRDGKVIPFTVPVDICPKCLAKDSFGKDASKRFEKEQKKLQKRYLDNISCNARMEKGHLTIDIEGPEELINHGSVAFTPSKPDRVLINRLKERNLIKLTRSEIIKKGIHKNFSSELLEDIHFDLATSQIFHTSFLTERTTHIDFLNSLSGDLSLQRRNQIIEKYLTTFVPFIKDVPVSDLIKIRKRAEESFILFRQGLNKAVDEYIKNSSQFTEQTAKEIYSDIVAPQLAKLDLKISSAKRDLVKSTTRKTIGWIGSISFGIYTGFIPTELASLASGLGLAKVGAELLELSMNKSDTEESIRNEGMYFLWKVRKLEKR